MVNQNSSLSDKSHDSTIGISGTEEGRVLSKFLTDKPAGKRPLGRPRTILEWTLKREV